MERRLTTRCCSALALSVVFISFGSLVLTAQKTRKPDNTPLSLVPLVTVWTLTLNARLVAAPTYAGTHVYFPIDDGHLVAYDLKQGTKEWSIEAKPVTAAAVGQGLIFLVESNRLTARHQSDGSLAWELPWSEDLATPPTWDNQWLVVATKAGNVIAFRAADGTKIWTRKLDTPAHTQPALGADHVYVATENNIVTALKVTTGDIVWTRRLGGVASGLLALDDQIFTGASDNYFYCLIAQTGEVDWRWRAGADPVGQPVVDQHNVYFVALDNAIRALSRGHGVQQWIRLLPLRPTRGPAMAGSNIVVTGIAQTVRIYNTKDGTPASDFATNGEVAADPYVPSDPAVSMPQLLVVTRDIVKGAIVTLFTRQIEPKIVPVLPLPNPVALPATLPSSAPTSR